MIRELSPSTLHTQLERERKRERERERERDSHMCKINEHKKKELIRVRSGNCEMYVINQLKLNAPPTIYINLRLAPAYTLRFYNLSRGLLESSLSSDALFLSFFPLNIISTKSLRKRVYL